NVYFAARCLSSRSSSGVRTMENGLFRGRVVALVRAEKLCQRSSDNANINTLSYLRRAVLRLPQGSHKAPTMLHQGYGGAKAQGRLRESPTCLARRARALASPCFLNTSEESG